MLLARNTARALLVLSGSLVSAAAEAPLPDAVAAPGETAVLSVHAEGAQVYECKSSADGKLKPLAVTSTAGWIRRLGGRRWATLHRLIYATGVGAVIHYWWLVKADIRRPPASCRAGDRTGVCRRQLALANASRTTRRRSLPVSLYGRASITSTSPAKGARSDR